MGDPDFLALACAPHQVYGPRDNLFMPNMLEAAGTGKLRIFGDGLNRCCWTYVDNYCHGLIVSEQTLRKGSPTLGKFYICTDGDTHPYGEGYALFWDEVEKAVLGMGFPSIKAKYHLPKWLMLFLGGLCSLIGHMIGRMLKLNMFAVRMTTMHRWFTITAAEKELGYKPLVTFSEGTNDTIDWFRANWLPMYYSQGGGSFMGSIATQTKAKIDIQASGSAS